MTRILVTGISSYWGGRLAQALEQDDSVETIIGVSPDDPTLGLESLNGTGRPWGRAGLRPGAGPGRSARGQAVPHLLRFLACPSELQQLASRLT